MTSPHLCDIGINTPVSSAVGSNDRWEHLKMHMKGRGNLRRGAYKASTDVSVTFG